MKVEKRIGLIGACLLAVVVWTTTSVFAQTATKPVSLKLQSHMIPPDMNRTTGYFVHMVDKISNGQIKITPHPVGTLVPTREILDALRSGTIDMAQLIDGYWPDKIQGSEVAAGLPFTFRSEEAGWNFVWHRGLVELMREQYAKYNIYYIPYFFYSIKVMTKKPINKVEDFKGMKIRSSGACAMWLNECGASTVNIAGGELYTALATGVVDGAHWGDEYGAFVNKFHEVTKYLMEPGIARGQFNIILVNMDVWKKLSSEQKMMIETAAQSASYFATNNTRMCQQRCVGVMVKDFGVKVTRLAPEEEIRAEELGLKVMDKIAKKNEVNARVVEMVKKYLKETDVPEKVEKFPW